MIRHYRAMADDPRLPLFERAIAAAVRPGDVVADIGCGLGTFAVFACRAGAARVWAVEEGPIVDVAREVVRANGCADRVSFLVGRSTAIDPPEPARVVLFEDYRLGLTTPSVARTVADLQRRWLAPGGLFIPGRARQLVAAVEDAAGRAEIDRFADRGECVSGVSLAPTRRRAFAEPFLRRLPAEALLAPPLTVREVAVVDAAPRFAVEGEVVIARDGVLHGLLLWLELEVGATWHSNAPGAPPSAWTPLEFPLDPPLLVRAGTKVQLALEAGAFGDELVYRWSATADGHTVAVHSLDSMPLALPRGADAVVPPEAVELERAILASVDGRRTVGEIAALIAARFPEAAEGALERVKTLLRRSLR